MEQQRVNLRLIKIESITLKERGGKNEKFFYATNTMVGHSKQLSMNQAMNYNMFNFLIY